MQDKKEEVMKLWRHCFDDSEDFVQLYFRDKYEDENALVYTENGKALSACLMLPYSLKWLDRLWGASYISGACTLPEARRRGCMARLLCAGFREMYLRNMAFSILIPANEGLFDYYARLGYATVFYRSTAVWTLDKGGIPAFQRIEVPDCPEKAFNDAVYVWYGERLRQHQCYVAHTKTDFGTILEDLYLSGGRLVLVRQPDGNISGMAFAVPAEGKVMVPELLSMTVVAEQALLQGIADYWEQSRIEYRTGPAMGERCPYGMARIIRVREVLEHFARCHPEMERTFKVTDPVLPENQAIYSIREGACVRMPYAAHGPGEDFDIPALSGYILEHDTSPYMSLMLD